MSDQLLCSGRGHSAEPWGTAKHAAVKTIPGIQRERSRGQLGANETRYGHFFPMLGDPFISGELARSFRIEKTPQERG
jgi:hypothetical protein